MLTLLSAFLVASSLTSYPLYGDRSIVTPRATASHPRVEAAVDKGLVVELIVRCPAGTAIVSYSKPERLFCGPHGGCTPSLGTAVSAVCRTS